VTFEPVVKAFPEFHMYPAAWVGKCIHCNSKLFVTDNGSTDATVEHIKPLCDDGDPTDPRNLALACRRCNNEKGVRHDMHAGKGGRADEVIAQLQAKREERWRSAP
jgi:5-methylcytosine-specific restriction endonuclease McrA